VQIMQPLDTVGIPSNKVTNGTFATDTDWTKGTGWTISAGVANATTASTDLEQTPGVALTDGVAYEVVYVATRSAGTVTVKLGGTAGTTRSTAATFTETIIAGAGGLIEFTGAGFTGTIDNVTVIQVPIPITPAASGSSNDMALVRADTGNYWLELTADNLKIAGYHRLTAFIANVLIVQQDFVVRDEVIYDAFDGPTPTMLTSRDIGSIFESTIGTVTSDTIFVSDVDINFNDIHIGQTCLIHDISGNDDWVTYVTDIVASSNTITVHADPQANGVVMPFTLVTGDTVRIETRMHPMYVARASTVSPYLASSGTADVAATQAMIQENFQLALRSDAAIKTDLASRLTAINADEGSGGGDYDPNTDSLEAVDASIATAQSDLDTVTGSDGATLATAQALYAPSKAGDAMDLLANALDSGTLDTTAVDEIVAAVWAKTLGATGLSASALVQVIAGVAAAKVSGAETTTMTFRNIQDSGNMIVATVDVDGNRSVVNVTTPTT
jgi:hypothetical protein